MSQRQHALLRFVAYLAVFAGISQNLTAAELLSNPGFELGTALTCCQKCYSSSVPYKFWTYKSNCPQPYDSLLGSSFWDGGVVSWGGGPRVHGGSASVRAYHLGGCLGDEKPGWRTASIEQTVDVIPNENYTASAWVYIWYAFELPYDPGTYAKLTVHEQNLPGNTIVTHEQFCVDPADVNKWKQLSISFHTNVNTSKVRFVLEQHWLQCCYREHITWDDCALDGPMPSISISSAKRMPDGAAVKVADKTVTAKFNGFFYIQESDRSGGIRVNGSAEPGDIVEVVGNIITVNNTERAITAVNITKSP